MLYRSSNMGESWQLVIADYYTPLLSFPDGTIWAVHSNRSELIFRSTDNGHTWLGADTLNAFAGYTTAVIDQTGSVFVGTYRSGMFKRSIDGTTWEQTNAGFPNLTSQISTIAEGSGGVAFAGTSSFGCFTSTDGGENWARNFPGYSTREDNSISRLAVHPSGLVFAATDYAYAPWLMFTSDQGDHWQFPAGFAYANDVCIGSNGIVYICGAGGVQRSTDLGTTWNTLPCPGSVFRRIHVTNQGNLVVLTTMTDPGNGTWYYTETSTDAGTTWAVSSPRDDRTPVGDYASTPNGYIFAATPNGVYRSTNVGLSWSPVNSGLASTDVQALTSNPMGVIFAGTNSSGVFRSTNYGEEWESFNTALTDSSITSLYCNPSGYLYAGGRNLGIFKTVESTTGVDPEGDIPTQFSLSRNYPNPFNPTTEIRYHIPHSSYVSLKVFDVIGREVVTLVDDIRVAGNHNISWNASGVPSGVYFYRLQAGNFMKTRKLVILK
jgi:photosystem II stability/assembly factor-like uncharacterized protein